MHCAANIRNFSQKFAARCKFLPILGIFCNALHFPYFYEKFRNEEFHNRNIAYDWINTFLARRKKFSTHLSPITICRQNPP